MIEWNIQSRAHACQACGKDFTDKQHYHTLLFDEKREYLRMDVCEPCWQSQYSQGANDRKGFISHWQGVYHAPPAAPPDVIAKESAETLLRKLIELSDPQYASACYILAVMLERKRILKVQSQFRQDDRRFFVYEHPKNGDVFTIADPNLQLDQLEEIQRQVAHLMEFGLPQAEGAAPAAPPAEGAGEASAPAASAESAESTPSAEPSAASGEESREVAATAEASPNAGA